MKYFLVICFAFINTFLFAQIKDSDLVPFTKDGLSGFIDEKENVIVELKYKKVNYYSEGYASVKLDGKWGFIDKVGTMVINPQFDDAYGFYDGLASVELGGKSFKINRAGQVLLDPTCSETR